jgi:hypothetical protein
MFDRNIVVSWRTFIHLKSIRRLGFKTSNVAKFMKAEFFAEIRPKGGWSLVILDLANCQVKVPWV